MTDFPYFCILQQVKTAMPRIHVCRFSSRLSEERKKALWRDFVRKTLRSELGEEVRIGRQPQGKPCLVDYPGFFFNCSDSGDYAVLATDSHEIGVDLEVIRPRPYREILHRFFLPEEARSVLVADSEQERLHLFFKLWTGKESLLKQVGCGLGADMRRHLVVDGKPSGAVKGLELRSYLLREERLMPYDASCARHGDAVLTVCARKGGTDTVVPHFIPLCRE